MFDKWLDEDTEASWNKLIDALKTIEQFALAEKISSNVLKGLSSTHVYIAKVHIPYSGKFLKGLF